MEMVYKRKSECCGCGACKSVCSRGAIQMVEDRYGFVYPSIDRDLCVDCGKCKKICAFTKTKFNHQGKAYAATNTNIEQKQKSSSAGIFPAIAEQFINDKGIVVGSSLQLSDGKASINHMVISSKESIEKIQGSKYVQSTIDCYSDIEAILKKGKKVLFSGTPCQVGQIKKRFKSYQDNLFTIDIVCHGVPNQKFFNDYLELLGEKNKGDVINFLFRDKKEGWGLIASAHIRQENGRVHKIVFEPEHSSYYFLFLKGEIYRDCCYKCPYARKERVGDITLGDYWGIEKELIDKINERRMYVSNKEGISCVLVNTFKGENLLEKIDSIIKQETTIDRISDKNEQLRKASTYTDIRNDIFEEYANNGYKKMDKMLKGKMIKMRTRKRMRRVIPQMVLKRVKR